jgi:hypothetical protein
MQKPRDPFADIWGPDMAIATAGAPGKRPEPIEGASDRSVPGEMEALLYFWVWGTICSYADETCQVAVLGSLQLAADIVEAKS